MPIYEYQCAVCHNIDEHLMKFSDPAPDGCTKCGGAVAKKISNTSFSLKGEGWYVTDYKPKHKEEGATPVVPAVKEGGKEAAPAAESSASNSAGGSDKSAAPKGDKSQAGGGEKSSSGEKPAPAAPAAPKAAAPSAKD